MILLTELKDKTANHLRPMATAMASMLLLSILAPNSSGGTNDGVLNFIKTPLLLRQPTITTFDGPGAGTGPGQGTIAFAINPAGTISGRYADSAGAIHAILRFANGSMISFDAPGAGTGNRGLLLGREQCVPRFPAHSVRRDHYLQHSECGHISRRGYLCRQHQSGGGGRGTLR